jgi:indolepyruvate ferredoxin oxidoreductase beta subunit
MKTDIILAGVGGQGILSIAACIGMAALHEDLNIKQAEVHGMSQRGGAVQSHLRISSQPIASDLIPKGKADLILSVEPMESLRYLPWLADNGWLVSNRKPFVNIPDYPDFTDLEQEIRAVPRHMIIDADQIAADLGSRKSSNMVMLGAALPGLEMDQEKLEGALGTLFARKGEQIVEMNIAALRAGKEAAGRG